MGRREGIPSCWLGRKGKVICQGKPLSKIHENYLRQSLEKIAPERVEVAKRLINYSIRLGICMYFQVTFDPRFPKNIKNIPSQSVPLTKKDFLKKEQTRISLI